MPKALLCILCAFVMFFVVNLPYAEGIPLNSNPPHYKTKKSGVQMELRFNFLSLNLLFYAYASVGIQAQIKFLSPWVLFTRPTVGQNLAAFTYGNG